MTQQKNFISLSSSLISFVDFIKWTSTFGEGVIHQMETPVTGVRLSAGLSRLFGISVDEAGIMLTMHVQEGPWLTSLPIECAFIGYGDELLVVTEEFELLDVPFHRIGIGIFVPEPSMREEIAKHRLLGFALTDGGPATRTNRIVPLYTPERYEEERIRHRSNSRSLFGGPV